MYLKSIKAVGFKSFADKTIIDFDKDITAVVGPNGSGKSNVVDAIRWVLGEQSLKELRGATIMSDVIFSGSQSRDALKKAYVTLTFDNSDHYLNSEFDEIEIKREVYKTGDNEYYINNAHVRLKDIKNLFLDSGAGTGAFNIISQGNITDIVNSKPQDRRVIFESAAGVLKYKTRKEEAIRKLSKTKDNLSSIKLVIDELAKTVSPLEKQSENAKKYLKLKEKSKNLEISLLSEDIEDYYKKLTEYEHELEILNKNLVEFGSFDLSKIELLKLQNVKIEDEIAKNNQDLISINNEISKLSSEKQITIERQRFSNKNLDVNDSLLKLKEEESALIKALEILKNEKKTLDIEKKELNIRIDELSNLIITSKIKKSNMFASIDKINKNIMVLENKVEIIKNNIQNNEFYPKSVRSVINNSKLNGIVNTIGQLIESSEVYELALKEGLGAATNFIVTDDFNCAKKAINYLKINNFGRATFYPMDTIKSRYITKDKLNRVISNTDYLGVLSDLIKYDKLYQNIVENVLGNILVVKSVDSLETIGKSVDYRYKIVSLDGAVLFAGGSVAGGSDKQSFNYKNELKKLERELSNENKNLIETNRNFKKLAEEYNKNDELHELLQKKNILLNESISNKDKSISEIEYNLENKILEIKGINNVSNNKLEDELINLIELLTQKAKEKISVEENLKQLKDKKSDTFDNITSLESEYRVRQSEISKVNLLIKNKEIECTKIEVKVENMLNNLSEEFGITYELAKEEYFLDIEKNEARNLLNSIKRDIKLLGDVNIGAIEQYETLSERFNFLKTQESDLLEASDNLLSIIDEMDVIMIEKFKKSFNLVSKEFKEVFKKIFQGGKGELRLTNPEDLLNTGIEIIAEPPGKRLNSTVALSGGEKSLTAICLLFSILNVRPVPFIILDEAEAALDEANVDMFGKYINNMKKSTQFILITHKKRMMEYADLLYGITMQESGVSKIVSTKLEN